MCVIYIYIKRHIQTCTVNPHYLESLYLLITYSLKFIHNPKVNTHGSFITIYGHTQNSKNWSCLTHTFPTEIRQSNVVSSYFSSHAVL